MHTTSCPIRNELQAGLLGRTYSFIFLFPTLIVPTFWKVDAGAGGCPASLPQLLLKASGWIADDSIEFLFLRGDAEHLWKLCLWNELKHFFVAHPGCGKNLRIGQCNSHFQIVLTGSPVAFL